MLYSSSMADKGTHYLQMQIVWGSIGLLGCAAATGLDYRKLKKGVWPFLAVTVLLLGFVMVAPASIAPKINGAHRWFRFHGAQFQPSELSKLALILAVAWYAERFQRKLGTWKFGFLGAGALIGSVLGLIFIEPDRGTTMLMAAVTAIMLFVAGARWKHITVALLLGVAIIAASLQHDSMRHKRLSAWLKPEEHKTDSGYQSTQALLALGAGGWTGLGLGDSREKLGFLPEHNTDFIFSIIGEELGLIGTLLVVITFVLLIISGLSIASHASDNFGMLLATGVTFLIGLQAFINIGVVTSVLPNKGLPLPFISYGGSNLIIMLTSVGLLLSVARRARVAPTVTSTSLEPEMAPQAS